MKILVGNQVGFSRPDWRFSEGIKTSAKREKSFWRIRILLSLEFFFLELFSDIYEFLFYLVRRTESLKILAYLSEIKLKFWKPLDIRRKNYNENNTQIWWISQVWNIFICLLSTYFLSFSIGVFHCRKRRVIFIAVLKKVEIFSQGVRVWPSDNENASEKNAREIACTYTV